MKQFLTSIGLAVLGTLATSAFAVTQAPTTIINQTFEGGPQSSPSTFGGSVVATQGYSALGFGNYLYQATSTPTASISFNDSDPGSYTNVTLSLSLAIIDSWDGVAQPEGPDHFTITVDGVSVFDAVFDNYGNSGPTIAAGLTTLSYGSDLGFNSGYNDAAYTLTLSLGALAPNTLHTFAFTASDPAGNWQGGSDESLGIDNILLTGTSVTAVPEPANAALFALGLAGLGALTRRRRSGLAVSSVVGGASGQ